MELIATICLILNKSCNKISTFLSLKLLKNEKLTGGHLSSQYAKGTKILKVGTYLSINTTRVGK